MNSDQLINFMENLRYERGLTLEKYLDGIVSERQYYRYRSSSSEAPFEVVLQLAERLQIPYWKLVNLYNEENRKEAEKVQNYFNLVTSRKDQEAAEEFAKLSQMNIRQEDHQIWLKVGNFVYEHNQGRLSKIELSARIKETIKYDEIMKRSSIHDVELFMLGLVLQFSDADRVKLLDHIINLNREHKLLTGGNVYNVSQVFFWIIKSLGRERRFEEVVELSKDAVAYSMKHHSFYILEYFHYYKALAHLYLENKQEFEKELYETILCLQIYDQDKRDKFYAQILKDTKIDPLGFYIDRLNRTR